MRWFESQEISADTAAFVMSTAVGMLVGEIFAEPAARQRGLQILIAEMMQVHNDDDLSH